MNRHEWWVVYDESWTELAAFPLHIMAEDFMRQAHNLSKWRAELASVVFGSPLTPGKDE